MTPITGSLATQDVSLRFRIDGDDGAPPLLLSNSLGTDLAMWDPQVPLLAAHFRVVRYDTRGHGESSVPAGPYTLDQLGRDVVALLDHLHIDRTHFCGLSMGGLTGLWLAIHAPTRIDRLALANTGAKIGAAEMWNERIDALRPRDDAPLPDELVEVVIGRWFTPRSRATAPAAVERVRRMLADTTSAGYAANCAAIRDADLRAALPRSTGRRWSSPARTIRRRRRRSVVTSPPRSPARAMSNSTRRTCRTSSSPPRSTMRCSAS